MRLKMEYLVVIEKAADGSHKCLCPDLPGCVACGETAEDERALIQEAIRLHIESAPTPSGTYSRTDSDRLPGTHMKTGTTSCPAITIIGFRRVDLPP